MVRAPIIIQGSIVFGIAIAVQVGLDFLGFGDQSIPTWGNMLNDGFTNLYRDPQLVVWPGLAIVLTTVALTLFANALRDELEQSARPRRRRRAAAAVMAADLEGRIVTPSSTRRRIRPRKRRCWTSRAWPSDIRRRTVPLPAWSTTCHWTSGAGRCTA